MSAWPFPHLTEHQREQRSMVFRMVEDVRDTGGIALFPVSYLEEAFGALPAALAYFEDEAGVRIRKREQWGDVMVERAVRIRGRRGNG